MKRISRQSHPAKFHECLKPASSLTLSIVSSGKPSDFSFLNSTDNRCSANEEAAQNARIEAMRKPTDRPLTKIRTPTAGSFERRPFLERKAALNLVQLAGSSEAPISADKVDNLIRMLIVSP